jgi:hypothetical protein
MEITFRGGTFSEISYGDSVLTLDSVLIASSGGLRDLSAQGRRDSANVERFGAIMNGHLSAFSQIIHIARQLMSHLLNGKPSPQEGTCFTVLREHHIDVFNGSSGANTSRLLTELGHIETDSALSL